MYLITKLILDNHFLSKGWYLPHPDESRGGGRNTSSSPDFAVAVFKCESEFLFFAVSVMNGFLISCCSCLYFKVFLMKNALLKTWELYLKTLTLST